MLDFKKTQPSHCSAIVKEAFAVNIFLDLGLYVILLLARRRKPDLQGPPGEEFYEGNALGGPRHTSNVEGPWTWYAVGTMLALTYEVPRPQGNCTYCVAASAPNELGTTSHARNVRSRTGTVDGRF